MAGNRQKLFWIIGLVLLTVASFSAYNSLSAHSTEPLETSNAKTRKKIGPSALTGRCLRPDGGHVIQLSDIRPNGQGMIV